jgi:hypothetical protein
MTPTQIEVWTVALNAGAAVSACLLDGAARWLSRWHTTREA